MCGTALALVTLIAALAVALVYPTLFQSEPPLASTVNNTYDFIIGEFGNLSTFYHTYNSSIWFMSITKDNFNVRDVSRLYNN